MKDETVKIWFSALLVCQVVLAVCGFLMQAQLNELKSRPAAPCVAVQQFEDLDKRVREIETRIKIGELIEKMDESEKAAERRRRLGTSKTVTQGICRVCGKKAGKDNPTYCDVCLNYAAGRNVRADELEE